MAHPRHGAANDHLRYDYKIIADHSPGTYWAHPHHHGSSAELPDVANLVPTRLFLDILMRKFSVKLPWINAQNLQVMQAGAGAASVLVVQDPPGSGQLWSALVSWGALCPMSLIAQGFLSPQLERMADHSLMLQPPRPVIA
ncbi:mco [Symbiodinium natans]|uniref:Mco protein n=1 Tax=Symbiodinium natans TaxID=878477 RepID=A0A812GNH4_9DINO|nr:mco [Symbiodinium natans]